MRESRLPTSFVHLVHLNSIVSLYTVPATVLCEIKGVTNNNDLHLARQSDAAEAETSSSVAAVISDVSYLPGMAGMGIYDARALFGDGVNCLTTPGGS